MIGECVLGMAREMCVLLVRFSFFLFLGIRLEGVDGRVGMVVLVGLQAMPTSHAYKPCLQAMRFAKLPRYRR
jgi:hypothetical protein